MCASYIRIHNSCGYFYLFVFIKDGRVDRHIVPLYTLQFVYIIIIIILYVRCACCSRTSYMLRCDNSAAEQKKGPNNCVYFLDMRSFITHIIRLNIHTLAHLITATYESICSTSSG